MKPTYQNRKTGEFFERVWINGSHVGLVSLTDQREVKVRRSNLLKSYALAEDYRHVPPAPDPPEPMGEPLPPIHRLPGPTPAPRPISFGWRDALHATSEGEQPAPASSSRDALVRGGEPPGEAKASSSRPSEDNFWTWPYVLVLVLSALFVVVMWIAVLS